MRSGDARPGQRVAVSVRDLDKKLEGIFLYEDGDTSIVAVNALAISGEGAERFGTPVVIAGHADRFVSSS